MSKFLHQIPVTALKGVGPRMAEKLQRMAIHNVQDLLFHLPLRYQDRTRITPIRALRVGHDAVIDGHIIAADIVFGRRRSLLCRVQDPTGYVTLRFFYFSSAQKRRLSVGTRIRCFGEVRYGHQSLELIHPECTVVDIEHAPPLARQLTPIYPSIEGINQVTWRKLCAQAVSMLHTYTFDESWPQLVRGCVATKEALLYLHQPPRDAPLSLLRNGQHAYQKQLAFEELLAHTLSILKLRQRVRLLHAPIMPLKTFHQPFLQQLPFTLTTAQQRVVAEISRDLNSDQPMMRLLQGDVGSGKTVVAALTALQAVASGYQVAIMAPTEILAEQHWANFSKWFASLPVDIGYLTAKTQGKQRREQLTALANQRVHMMIGTHALFQQSVNFAQLGLIIIDEQHRFGVHQRLALKNKASQMVDMPHQLIMTATPIPRTLAMSAYADLDVSMIDQLPPGRAPVDTLLIDNGRRQQVMARIRNACCEGRQVYWVCTLIEDSDVLIAKTAESTYQILRDRLPEVRLGLVHGRLKADEKTAVMQAFKTHRLDLLVATTVIEVGVDVPNASVMVIDNAERLGLSQLHQLRGRVGRGATKSHCILLYQQPLSKLGKERLQIMRHHHDGFVIAQKDLELRGPGELLGTRQTGLMQLRMADFQRDAHLLDEVRRISDVMIRDYPECMNPLIERWLGDGEGYAQV